MAGQMWMVAAVYSVAVIVMSADGATPPVVSQSQEPAAAATAVVVTAVVPADGYIDPRRHDADESSSRIVIEFSRAVTLEAKDVVVTATGGAAPSLATMEPSRGDTVWTLDLSGPLPEGEFTHVTVADYGTLTYGAVPGDVDQDGSATPADYDAMELALKSSAPDPRYYDIDGDGDVNADDLAAALDIAADGIPVVCCVFSVQCEVYMGTSTCPTGTTQVACPCPPPPPPPGTVSR